MRNNKFSIGLSVTIAIFTMTLPVTTCWAAAREKVLYSFNDNGVDGRYPVAGLIFDSAGNLYGTTEYGGSGTDCGTEGCGTVFELTPKEGGGWTEDVLHSFSGKDGALPNSGLILDTFGNLYGTTFNGGAHNRGTVFELSPKSGGGWTEKVLYSFKNSGKDDFGGSYAGLIFDKAGNLYGTTGYGGAYNYGTVFELSPKSGGGWTEKILHNFNHNGKDGTGPIAGLIFDAPGNLYGTTEEGGAYGYAGTVFELSPKAGGRWAEKILYSFNNNGKDGYSPTASLIFDTAGNLYGTTGYGGAYGYGTAFELSQQAIGTWAEQILFSFSSGGMQPSGPISNLIFDSVGNLYGTSSHADSSGTAFELSPGAGGWTEEVLIFFGGNDGLVPYAGLIFDNNGNLYGTTAYGGTEACQKGIHAGCGTVFEITP